MFSGAHFLLYSHDADADRAFIRDVLGFKSIDVGGGWLIFGLPPAELAVHPTEDESGQEHGGRPLLGAVLYLMCDDVKAVVARLATKGVNCSATSTEPWGIRTTIPLPSGGELGLYQPTHPTALGLV